MLIASLSIAVDVYGEHVPASQPRLWTREAIDGIRHQTGCDARIFPQRVGRVPSMGLRSGARVLIQQPGGIGDMLMLSASIDAAARAGIVVDLAIPKNRFWIFGRKTSVRTRHVMPARIEALGAVDCAINLDAIIRQPNGKHAVQAILARLSVRSGDTAPTLALDDVRIDRAHMFLRRIGRPRKGRRLGVWQSHTSSVSRDVPRPIAERVMRATRGVDWLIVGTNDRASWDIDGADNAVNLVGAFPDIIDLACVVSLADVVVAPDSSMTHVAAALGIPCVAIYGPVDHTARAYASTIPIFAHRPCQPCDHHGALPCVEAVKSGVVFSPCIAEIAPEAIVAAIADALSTR